MIVYGRILTITYIALRLVYFMDPIRNPFVPGAGSQPAQLSGRTSLINAVGIALQRTLLEKHSKSLIMLGLRGTGKTVLLRYFENQAESMGYKTSFIEAPENKKLPELIYPRIHQVLRKLSMIASAKTYAHAALKALRSFSSAFKLSLNNLTLEVEPEPGMADSGILEYDLSELFIQVGLAARAAGLGWALFIDELQYLSQEELSALIVAIHQANQKGLPILFLGAGLPQIAALSGDAKSYAERLFDYPRLDALDKNAAFNAIEEPLLQEGENIEPNALLAIFKVTQGYPFFLQEWGYQAWNLAEKSPITRQDVENATPLALKRLDEGFFRVRSIG